MWVGWHKVHEIFLRSTNTEPYLMIWCEQACILITNISTLLSLRIYITHACNTSTAFQARSWVFFLTIKIFTGAENPFRQYLKLKVQILDECQWKMASTLHHLLSFYEKIFFSFFNGHPLFQKGNLANSNWSIHQNHHLGKDMPVNLMRLGPGKSSFHVSYFLLPKKYRTKTHKHMPLCVVIVKYSPKLRAFWKRCEM